MPKFWRAPAHWPGATVYIVGGGPSVADVDLTLLEGKRVIAINNAFRLLPNADILFFADTRWWRWYGSEVPHDFKGHIISVCKMADHYRDPRVLRMNRDYRYDTRDPKRNPDPVYLSEEPNTLSGPDSGYMAINLAYHYGVKRIVLIGYDMGFTNGEAHWHEDHPVVTPETNYVNLFAPHYPHLVDALTKRDVEVIRSTPSRLDFIPEVPLAEAVRLPDRRCD